MTAIHDYLPKHDEVDKILKRLNDVSDTTILFSDRPDRIVTSVSTADFVGNWTAGQDSFAADPPNAALVIANEDDTTIVELLNPTYDTDTKTLQYEARALNGTDVDIPSEFGEVTLINDLEPATDNGSNGN